MVAIVGGNSLGLTLTSLAELGQHGALGSAVNGRSGESIFVNAANGNLVLQDQDEHLAGRGLDALALRTYNSQGQLSDDNADNWSNGFYTQPLRLTGSRNTAGSSLLRTDRDGAQALYAFDTATSAYVSSDGAGAFDSIVYDVVADQYVWTDGDTSVQERYEGAASARLLSRTDTAGNTVNYAYTGALLTTVTTASGETMHFDYVGNNLSQVRTVDSNNATRTRTRYDYDTEGRLWHVTTDLSPDDNSVSDGDTYVTIYTYEGTSERVHTITQTDGTSVTFDYIQVNGQWRIETVTDALGHSTGFDYNGNETTITDALGNETVMRFDTTGRLIEIQAPTVGGQELTSSFGYNANGDVSEVVDGRGNAVHMGYDARGNQILQRDAAGNTVTRTYDARNHLLTETVYLIPDSDGAGSAEPALPQTTRYVYDSVASGRLRFVISAEGRVTEHRYNPAGEREATIAYPQANYAVGALTPTSVPSVSELSTWVEGLDLTRSTRVDMTYDDRGQLRTTTSYLHVDEDGEGVLGAGASITTTVYDRDGLLLNTTQPGGEITRYTYDGLGRVETQTDARLNTTVYFYDDANNRTEVRLLNGLVTTSAYDAAGRLFLVTQSSADTGALGQTRHAYDAANRLVMTQDPTGVRQWMLYDDAGRKVADIDADGTLTEYSYNASNLLTRTVVYAAAVDVSLLTLPNGQPATPALDDIRPASGPDAAENLRSWNLYDNAGRLAKSVDLRGSVRIYEYDGAGHLILERQLPIPLSQSERNALGSAPEASDINVVVFGDPNPPPPAVIDLTTYPGYYREVRNFYSADGLLIGKLDEEQYYTRYEYDAAGHLIATTRYAHRMQGELASGLTPPEVIANGATPPQGAYVQMSAVDAPEGEDQVTRLFYNNKGQLASEVDAENYLTEHVYDTNGNLSSSTRYAIALDQSLTSATQLGDLEVETSALDRTTSADYDDLGRLRLSTNHEGTQTRYDYDEVGNLTATTVALGTQDARTLRSRYDVQGRLTEELSAEGNALITGGMTGSQIEAIWDEYAVIHRYDEAGRRISTTDRNDLTTLYYYDVDGRLTYTINSLGEVEYRHYNVFGLVELESRLSRRIDTAGLTGGLETTEIQNAVNALLENAAESRTLTYYGEGTRDLRYTFLYSDGGLALSVYSHSAYGDLELRADVVDHETNLTRHEIYTHDKRGLVTHVQVTNLQMTPTSETELTYDAFGRVVQTDANGKVTGQSYDRLGRVVQTIDASNANRYTSYDAFGRVLTQTNALGDTTEYAYDDVARAVTVTTPEGLSVTTSRDRLGHVVSVTDARQNTTTYEYDLNGNLRYTRTPLTVTENRYDIGNRLVETEDARGNVVAYAYDEANRVLSVVRDPGPGGLNLTTNYVYDGKGQTVWTQDPTGTWTHTEYDYRGMVATVTVDPRRGPDWQEGQPDDNLDGLALTTTYTYDSVGQQLSVTSPEGTVTRYEYDILGRRTSETIDPDNLSITTSYTYDARGNVVSVLDDNGNRTRHVYDSNDRLVYSVNGAGGISKTEYDDEGRITRVTRYANAIAPNALAALPDQASEQEIAALVQPAAGRDAIDARRYDDDGRLTFSVDGTGAVIEYRYDENGNVSERIAYANAIDATAWDGSADPAPVADPLRDSRTRTVYDALNRVSFVANAIGMVTEYAYDANGNVTRETSHATTIGASDTLDSVVPHPDDRVTVRAYDAANRLTWVTDPAGAVSFTDYDKNGNVTLRTRFATKLVPGADPRDVVPSDGDRTTRHQYDALNRETYSANAEGFVTTRLYQDSLRQTVVTHFFRPATQANAMPAAWVGMDQVEVHEHDAAGRTIRFTDAAGSTERYFYDGVGNRTGFMNKKSIFWNYTYDAAGRLLTETAPPVTVWSVQRNEVSGNLTQGASEEVALVTRHTYDGLGNMLTRTEAAGRAEQRTTSYEYDAAGRQVCVIYPEVAVYVSEGTSLASNGQAGSASLSVESRILSTRTFYDALGNAVANIDVAGNASYKLYDTAGRVTHAIDAMGYVTRYEHNAFGEVETLTRFAATTALANTLPTSQSYALSLTAVDAALGSDRRFDRVIETRYDTLGQAVEVREPEVYNYDSQAGTPTGTYGRKITNSTYNAFGDLVLTEVSRTATQWSRTAYYYDRVGQQVAQVDAAGYLTARKYDAAGNMTEVKEYARQIAAPTSSSWQTLPSPPAAHADDRTVLYGYDRLNRRGSEVRLNVEQSNATQAAAGQSERGVVVTQWQHDALGNVIATIDAAGGQTFSYYDALGRVTAVAAPMRSSTVDGAELTPVTLFRRDAYGNVVAKIELANGPNAASVYNGVSSSTLPAQRLGYPTLVFDPARDHVTYSRYDSHGHQIQTTDANGYDTYSSFNERGEVAKTWQAVTSGSPAYDASTGRLIADSTSFTVYQYDKLGRLTHTLTPAPRGSVQVGIAQPTFSSSDYVPNYDEGTGYGYFYGYNTVNLRWANLVNPGAGPVRVELSYQSRPNVDAGTPSRPLTRPVAEYSASQALNGVTLSWFDSISAEGGISALTSIRITQQAADGSWSGPPLWEGTPAQANGDNVVLTSQAGAGVTDMVMAYNAFGEMTSKGVVDDTSTSGSQEYFDYDNAGRLWRTNTGDGVDRVMLYDLQGRNTALITSNGSFDLRPADEPHSVTAEQIAGNASLRRTDLVLDDLGRISRQIDPRRLAGADTAIVQNLAMSWGIAGSATAEVTEAMVHVSPEQTDPYGVWQRYASSFTTRWSGANHVNVNWSDLSAYGSGDVRVTMRYVSSTYEIAPAYSEWVSGEVSGTVYWGAVVQNGNPQTHTQIFNGGEADTGAVLSWFDAYEGANGGIGSILGIKVEKQDAYGNWQEIIADGTAPTSSYGTAVGVFTAHDGEAGNAQLYIHRHGTSTWIPVGINFGDGIRFDFSTLSEGVWDYEVRRTEPGRPNATRSTNDDLIASGQIDAGARSIAGAVNSPFVRPETVLTLDRWGNVLTRTDARNEAWVTNYAYNANNQVTRTVLPATDHNGPVSETLYFYDQLGRQVGARDARNNINGQRFDAAGNLVAEYHADGGIITHRYDAFGNKRSTTDAEGHTTDYAYDRLGRLLSTTHATVRQHSSRVAQAGPLSIAVTDDGQRRLADSNTYDQLGRKITQTNGLGETIRYRYDLAGHIIETTDALGAERGYSTKAIYDRLGRKSAELDANGVLATWNYDYFGRLVSNRDLGGYITAYDYDHAGQLTDQTSGRGQDIRYIYNQAGQQVEIHDEALQKHSFYDYDLAGNRVREKTTQGAEGGIYQDNHMAYDAQGRLRDVFDGRMHVAIDYDAMGNRTRIRTVTTAPTNGQPNLPLVSGTGAGATTTEVTDRFFQYDNMNRQTVVNAVDETGRLEHNEANPSHVITYDRNGNRKSDRYWGNDVTVTTTLTYRVVVGYYDGSGEGGYAPGPIYMTGPDGNPLQVQVGDPRLVMADGQLVFDTGETRWNEYVGDYRLTYPTAPLSVTTDSVTTGWVTDTYTYDGMNRLTATSRGSTVLMTNFYDGASRLVQSGAAAGISNGYMSLLSGSANSATPGTGMPHGYDQYVYDQAGRLTHQLNRVNENLSHAGHYGDPLSAVHNAGHAINATFFTYDNVGNVRQNVYDKFGVTYTYNFTFKRFAGYVADTSSGSATNGSSGKRWNWLSLAPFDDPIFDGVPFAQPSPEQNLLRHTGIGFNVGGFDGSTGVTQNQYDVNGHLVRAERSSGDNTDYVNDAQGRVLQATDYHWGERAPGQGRVRTNEQTQRSVLVNGEALGAYGVENGKPISDLNFSFDAIRGKEGSMGRYTVRAGDTLQSIARTIYGDASLWYRLADANNLSGGSALVAGQVLNAPAQPGSIHNNADTYKSYNQGRILTDSTPPLGMPGQPCGGNGEIIVAIVTIVVIAVVTYFTMGTGTAAVAGGAASGGTAAGGAAAGGAAAGGAAAGGAAAGGATAAGFTFSAQAVAMGALSAGAGALAGQAAAVAMNLQKDVNWKSVALAAAGGAIGGALGGLNATGQAVLDAAIRAALSNAASQGIGIALGMQEKFDWRSVAASAAGSVAGSALGGGAQGVGQKFALGLARGFVSSVVSSAVRGGEVKLSRIATDAFGNALAEALAPDPRVLGADMSAEQVATAMLADGVHADSDPNAGPAVPPGEAGGLGLGDEWLRGYQSRQRSRLTVFGEPVESEGISFSPNRRVTLNGIESVPTVRTVTVEAGSTLSQAAGTNDPATLDRIAQYNGLRSRHEVRAGQSISIPSDDVLAGVSVSDSVASRGAAGARYFAARQAEAAEAATNANEMTRLLNRSRTTLFENDDGSGSDYGLTRRAAAQVERIAAQAASERTGLAIATLLGGGMGVPMGIDDPYIASGAAGLDLTNAALAHTKGVTQDAIVQAGSWGDRQGGVLGTAVSWGAGGAYVAADLMMPTHYLEVMGAVVAPAAGTTARVGISKLNALPVLGDTLPQLGSRVAGWAEQGAANLAAPRVLSGQRGVLLIDGGGGSAAKSVEPGAFSIIDWAGYPSSIPKPTGPFRLLEGAEYSAARAEATAANRALHASDESLGGWQLHEIQPVKFGGSPTDIGNKMPLPAGAHSEVTNWWNALMRDLTRNPGGR